jgi:hypothetical protein
VKGEAFREEYNADISKEENWRDFSFV